MTYKKPLKAFAVTTLMGFSAQAMDTADGKRLGSYAIDAFEGKKTIETEDNDVKVLVPFHAVQTAMYATMTEDAEKADAYCGGGTEPTSETYTLKWTDAYDSTDVKVGDTLTSPPNPCGGWGAFQGWVFGGNEREPDSIVVDANTSFTFTKDMADVAIDGVISIGYTCVA